jgi:hypothetical protein
MRERGPVHEPRNVEHQPRSWSASKEMLELANLLLRFGVSAHQLGAASRAIRRQQAIKNLRTAPARSAPMGIAGSSTCEHVVDRISLRS